MIDSLKIGTYEGSYIHNLDSTQSVACGEFWGDEYFKHKTPTPGEENIGLCSGKIYGHFYINNDDPVRNAKFVFYNNMVFPYLYTDSTGYYTASKGARYYYYDALRYDGSGPDAEVWDFQPIEFDLEPGDSIEVNFIALQSTIIPVIQNTIKFNNYPHPASNYTWFFIDNTEIDASAMRVSVYALNGRKVDSFIPSAKQFRYDCSHLPQGSYVMSLQQGNEVLASKKLQVLK
jgi:type IX secretion system substrate protein